MTIEQAQKKLINSFATGTGADKDQLGKPATEMQQVALEYAEKFMNRAKEVLNAKGKTNTGALEESMTIELEEIGKTGFKIKFMVLDYYEFVDLGVRGLDSKRNINNTSPFKFRFAGVSKSHRVALEKWIVQNRLTATRKDVKKYGATGREKKAIPAQIGRQDLAYIIGKAIKKKGLERTGFWTDSWEQTFADFSEGVAKALGNDIAIDLKNMAEKIKRK